MKLSVIIVTYMFEDYIEQCLISALGQKTNFDYEILVRDDFSSDNSLNHIKRIAELNNKVKVFESDKNLQNLSTLSYTGSSPRCVSHVETFDGFCQ
jgi:glycosyltransferase involved in cell wall biosynthesis